MVTLEYKRDRDLYDDQDLIQYNDQMRLILEMDMETEKAIHTWRKAQQLLEMTEPDKQDQELREELENKVETYKQQYINQESIEVSGSVEMKNGDNFDPDPPSLV